MKLNPKKCTFEAEEGALLGHVVNMKGIEACPDKSEAVIRLKSPRTLKEVQSLNGKLASLNRFMSKSAEKSLPFFKTLKKCIKKSDFQWTTDAERSNQRGFANGKRPENAGRLAKWTFELGAFDINYRPHTSIRGQILADFIAERPDEDGPPTRVPVEKEIPKPWTLFTDGSSCLEGSGAGLIFTNPEGIELTYVLRFKFDESNNEAEYEALVAGLRITEQIGVKNLAARVDSLLVANQINGSYIVKEHNMIQYLEKAKTLISGFNKFSIEQVPISENKKADAFSMITSTSFAKFTKQVLLEVLKKSRLRKKKSSLW
ncbi:reverse transcriptase domain-containing protein [Tanacetum coccineum]